MRSLTWLAAVLTVLALAASAAQAAWTAPVPPEKLPMFCLPKMSTPPVIDGTIDPQEWREAAAVSGVGGCTSAELIARPTTYFLAWDEGHLYMAIRTWVRPGYKPRASGREPGSASVFEDGGEFHFQPMGKNVAPGRTSSSYKFILNTLGFAGDLQRVAVGQQFKNWMPEFKIRTRLTDPGSAPLGGRWWELEMSATTGDFELTGPNRAGDQWRFMLGFNHMYHGWTQARIAAITSYFDPGGYPIGTLVENTPAVQMTMDDLPGPMDGVAAMRISVYNPANTPAKADVFVDFADSEGGEMVKRQETLSLAPGKGAEVRIDQKLPRELTGKPGTIFVRVMQGQRELYRYFTFFKTVYPKEALAPAAPPKEAFPLNATFNPVRSTLMLVADAYYLDDPAAAQSVQWRVVRQDGSQTVATGTIDRAVTNYYRALIQLPPLDGGLYDVAAEMTLRDGKTLGPVKIGFKKLDEAKAFPEWWETRLGNTERVIAPFTPVGREGDAVSVWGRTYRLDALGLPAGIVSGGGSVSAAPARLVAVIGGKEHAINLSGAPRFTDVTEWRASFTGEAKGGGLKLSAQGWVEQDGMVFVQLTYGPDGAPVKLDALRIEYPLSPAEAQCLLCLGAGGNYAARTTRVIADAPEGRIWDTLETGRNGSGMTVGSFYPCVWIGNERRGLLWYADSDQGWVPADAVPAHDALRTADAVVLRNHIVGAPTLLDTPRTLRLSYMASPFRPLVKGWRAVSNSEDGTFSGPHKKRMDPKTGKEVDGWNWINPPAADPAEWSALWAEYKKQADARVHQLQPTDPLAAHRWMYVHTSLPLMGYGWKTSDERVTSYFAPEWESDSWNKTEQDYFLWLTDRAFREGGLRAIYWDIFFIMRFSSLQNGLAYLLPDGRVQPGFNGWNLRRLMMRMYELMDSRGLTPFCQMSHATNCYCLPACGWMDAILDGEYHSIGDDSGMDWVDGYPIDRMRAMSCSDTWGVQISWMNLISIKDPVKKAHALRGFADWPRMFDTWTTWFGGRMPEACLDFGLNDERVEFIPFWRNPYVTSDDPDILVSMWRLPDRVILSVFNYNGKARKDAVVKIDLDKLELVPRLPWQEFVGVRDLAKGEKEPKTTLDFYGRTLKIPALDPHTGRVVGVRLY